MHAARVQRRLGGRLCTYKFASRGLRGRIARAFAIDGPNERQLARTGLAAERIERVGNLAIDGALGEAAGGSSTGSNAARTAVAGGVMIMPGARRAEIASLVPFFLQAAVRLRALAPDLPIVFGLSPFTTSAELTRALDTGGDPRFWGARGRVVETPDGTALEPFDAPELRFPIVHDAMQSAPQAACALTIPGTKCIELAALGVPAVVCVPYNAPELAVINGPLTYLDRIPLAGAALKRAIVLRYVARFAYTAQPNIDADAMLMPELRGTLTPGYVANRVAAYLADDVARVLAAQRLRVLYAGHAGAAERMARALREFAR